METLDHDHFYPTLTMALDEVRAEGIERRNEEEP